MTEKEIKGRLDRIGKTPLEHFQDIKELELADEQLGVTVEYMFPYKCKQVEKSLKALEIIKEKNVNMFGFKRDIKQLGNRFTYKYYQSNLGNYHSGFDIQELTEEEFNLLKEVLE